MQKMFLERILFLKIVQLKNVDIKRTLCILTNVFAAFMVIGRTVSGVHWLTDIIGAVLLSAGMFQIYKAAVLINDGERGRTDS